MPKKNTEIRTVAPSTEPLLGDRRAQRWTFLSNHAHVLAIIHSHTDDMSLREVAALVGITERAVQRIIQELEEAGYLVRFRNGRRNQYKVRVDLPLRHPIEAHRNIGDLLALVQEAK
jgi:uncharacterized membrane protein